MSNDKFTLSTDHKVTDRTSRQRYLWGWVIFIVASLFLAALSAFSISERWAQKQKYERLEQEQQKLQDLVDGYNEHRQKLDEVERVVFDIMKSARKVSDLPKFSSDRVMAASEDMESFFIYVPSGTHTLNVDAQWSPAPRKTPKASTSKTKTADDGTAKLLRGSDSWSVTLPSNHCSVLSLDMTSGISNRTPFGWSVTSNSVDLEPQSYQLPLPAFGHFGKGYSYHSTFAIPNARRVGRASKLLPPQPMQLFELEIHGSFNGPQHDILLKISLESDTPPVVSVDAAKQIFNSKSDDQLLPYNGGGRFQVRE